VLNSGVDGPELGELDDGRRHPSHRLCDHGRATFGCGDTGSERAGWTPIPRTLPTHLPPYLRLDGTGAITKRLRWRCVPTFLFVGCEPGALLGRSPLTSTVVYLPHVLDWAPPLAGAVPHRARMDMGIPHPHGATPPPRRADFPHRPAGRPPAPCRACLPGGTSVGRWWGCPHHHLLLLPCPHSGGGWVG